MSKLSTAIRLLRFNQGTFFASILENLNFLFSDRLYLQLMFRCKMGYWMDFDKPKTFCEKMQWLKLYNRDPLYTTLVDKFAVKKWVADKIGEEYIIPMLGVWNNANEIDFEFLPNQFVLKTTNGGGGDVVICKNKSSFDKENAVKHLNQGLKKCIYGKLREWPYKNVPPRIIAEKYIDFENSSNNNDSSDLVDYKFFCFNGIPKFCQVIRNRSTKETIDFYDMEWNHMPFVGLNPVAKNGLIPVVQPKNLKDMISICEKLSEGFPFIRVDLYNVDGKIYFGELTFYPLSGLGVLEPGEWNYKLGDMIKIICKR